MKPQRVYFSARFARKAKLIEHRDRMLAECPHLRSCARWLDGEPQEPEAIAEMDLDDVLDATILIAFTETPVEFSSLSFAARGGRHVEFGLAAAAGATLLVVGPRENVFHHLRGVRQFNDFEACLEYLRRWT